MEQTREIVKYYLKMDHTMVLAIVPAHTRIRNSQTMQLIQEFKKEKHTQLEF